MGIILKGISNQCGINYDIASGGFKCVFSENEVVLEGIKSVFSFNEECIKIAIKRKSIEIKGKNLYIKELYKGFISIKGSIAAINLIQGAF